MTVKILIKRKFKDASLKDVSTLLIKSRRIAMEHKGYISSETLSKVDDPSSVLVLSMWHSQEDWENYKKSEARQENEKRFAEILERPTEYETFNMGLS